jgi:hypothetical protein
MKTSDANSDLFFYLKQNSEDFNSFLLLRMFVGAYQNSSDADFKQAVEQLFDAFKKERMGNVNAALQRRDANEHDIEKIRVANMEAVNMFIDNVKKYIATLRPFAGETPK